MAPRRSAKHPVLSAISSAIPPILGLLLLLPPPPAAAQKVSNGDLYEKSLQAAQGARTTYGEHEDAEQLRRVADIAYRLVKESRYEKFPFTFHLLDMPIPNAFALPGGQIFITRGMLELGLDDDMLAALLGHEIAHVAREHGLKMQRRATLLNALSQAVLVGVLVSADGGNDAPADHPYSIYGRRDDDRGDLIQGTAATSLVISQLLLLSYSRDFEDEADEEGQRLAAGAGFDPGGAQRLWNTMLARLPQNKEYGYWRTHPFADSRMKAAEARGQFLKVQEPSSAEALRQATQAALLEFAARPKLDEELTGFLKEAALTAWPRGATAESLRLEDLHRARQAELERAEMERDYGALLAAYEEQTEQVRELSPESPLLAVLDEEIKALEKRRDAIYPKALEVFGEGVYQTSFLEVFLSNFPEAPEVPEVALALGDAYSRLRQTTEAVEQYLTAWRAAPESAAGKRAREGLRNLAPYVEQLAALQQLAGQEEDGELARLARQRLAQMASTYSELANGAEYLKRYPDGEKADTVARRLDTLAEKLYTEVIVYQGVGDSVKALERIHKILTYAPLSPAAERLRDQAVLES